MIEKIARNIINQIKKLRSLDVKLLLFLYKRVFNKLSVGENVVFNGRPLLRIYGRCVLGDNLVFNGKTEYNTVGIFKRCSIFVGMGAELFVGDNSGFSGVSIHCEKKIIIGQYCNFGGNVSIWDTDFHSLDYMERRMLDVSKVKNRDIVVGDDVFVGANSIILKGVKIGDRAIIGAGSVITHDIPSDQIWAGNPAKFIRNI